MTRLLFWIALIILVVWAVRSKFRAAIARAQAQAQAAASADQGAGQGAAAGAWRRVEDQSERMCNCAQCGIYFPASEAVQVGGREYCSPAHAQLAQK